MNKENPNKENPNKENPNIFNYPCDQCDQSFDFKSNLYLHRQTKHKRIKNHLTSSSASSTKDDPIKVQNRLEKYLSAEDGWIGEVGTGDNKHSSNRSSIPKKIAKFHNNNFSEAKESFHRYDSSEDAAKKGAEQNVGVAVGAGVKNNGDQTFQNPSELLQFLRKDPLDKKYYCTLCEKFSHKAKNLTRNHVESKHFPNTFNYPCDQCE